MKLPRGTELSSSMFFKAFAEQQLVCRTVLQIHGAFDMSSLPITANIWLVRFCFVFVCLFLFYFFVLQKTSSCSKCIWTSLKML